MEGVYLFSQSWPKEEKRKDWILLLWWQLLFKNPFWSWFSKSLIPIKLLWFRTKKWSIYASAHSGFWEKGGKNSLKWAAKANFYAWNRKPIRDYDKVGIPFWRVQE